MSESETIQIVDNPETPAVLYVVCADMSADNQAVFGYAVEKARQSHARIGLFGCIQMQDFQNWASIEGAVRQELQEQCEKELWEMAGRLKEMGAPTTEFLIEEGAPLEALAKIIGTYPEIAEIIIAVSKPDIGDYQDADALSKFTVPLVFVPPNLR